MRLNGEMLIVKIKNKTGQARGQRGVALLFALGIMSLLLVLALAFVTNAAVNRRIAANNTAKAQTDALASSAVQRTIAMMNLHRKHGSPQDVRQLVSSSTLAGATLEDQLKDNKDSKGTPVASKLAVSKYANTTEYIYDPEAASVTNKPKWQFIQDTDGRIIGRYAYAVLPEPAKIDIEESVTTPNVARLGASSSEIKRSDLINVGPSLAAWQNPGVGTRWLSYDHAALKNNLATDSADRDILVSLYNVVNPPDMEVFWSDDNGDGKQDHKYFDGVWKTEFYHRFQLNRTDWSTVTVDMLLGDAEPLIKDDGKLNVGILNGNKIPAFSSDAIPYLRKIGDAKGNYDSIEARRKQVAANLIAYSRPLTEPPPTDYASGGDATYFGNLRAPYLDRFGFNISAACRNTGDIPDGTDRLYLYELDVKMHVAAELINIFTVATPAATLSFEDFRATFTVTLPAGALSPAGGAINNEQTFTVSSIPDIAFESLPANSFGGAGQPLKKDLDVAVAGASPLQFALRSLSQPAGAVTIKSVDNFSFKRAVVKINGVNADYVRERIAEQPWDLSVEINTASDGKTIAFTADDPEENLNRGDWVEVIPAAAEQSQVTFPARSSSKFFAYIRHEPMKSPGELAYIARGEPGSHLNLTAAATTKVNQVDFDSKAETDGTPYLTGDAEILNQIKMTPNVSSYGKVDLSATADTVENRKVLAMLLRNVGHVSAIAEYDAMAPVAPQIDDAMATELAQLFDTALVGKNYAHRSAVATDLRNAIGTKFPTIAAPQDSELIGKILPLTKVGEFPTVIRMVVVAQSIRDVGGIGSVVKLSKINPIDNSTVTLDTQVGQFDRDPTTGIYFDEITGETKVLVTIVRDPLTNQYHVMSTEYLDQ